jgi:hypothetical protein
MLVEFRFENHRSIREEQALTMEAGDFGAHDDKIPRDVGGNPRRLLPLAALYGANASGKSNVLSALVFMCDAVLFSSRVWPTTDIPRDPFGWGEWRTRPSLFEVTFLIHDVRYQYGFAASDQRILEEWLHAWPKGKKQVWFERDETSFKFGSHLKGENKFISEVTRPNALFLSSAAQHNHARLTPIASWFQDLQSIRVTRKTPRFHPAMSTYTRSTRHVGRTLITLPDDTPGHETPDAESLLDDIIRFFKTADIGIVGLRAAQTGRKGSFSPTGLGDFELQHQCDVSDAWLPMDQESSGTQTLFRLAPALLWAIQNGGIVLIDELEYSLHPSLARHIVARFNDPAANPRNAQLLFSTHDTNLLATTPGQPALRRDQVWLTEKNDQGATELIPLTDYKPRKAENLEHGYLLGRYGAVPFLGNLKFSAD